MPEDDGTRAPPERADGIDPEAFRRLLLARRAELESVLDSAATAADIVELDQSRVGRLSRMDAMQSQAMAQASHRRRQQELTRIAAALVRLEAGEYGWCARCGEDIAPERLRLDPAITLCITCAQASER